MYKKAASGSITIAVWLQSWQLTERCGDQTRKLCRSNE